VSSFVIIVAGGSGSRMNSDLPKQFMELAGKPVLMHTIGKFYSADPAITIIVVLPEKEIKDWETLCTKHRFTIDHRVVRGGDTRFQSVKNGLALVKEKGVVAVHDGVRPLLSTSLIKKCFSEAGMYGSAVPYVPVRESLRKVSNNMSESVDRSIYVAIQTPQCFSSELLHGAYRSEYKATFTDDASVVESTGETIHLVEGETENIKITFPADLAMAEALVRKEG
jgi:2-C-methyl-D-erythritol 4-phosphate cytidylyltransferase